MYAGSMRILDAWMMDREFTVYGVTSQKTIIITD
jgi:hypothetical protein